MANGQSNRFLGSVHPMNGGDGPHSYTRNSSYQKMGVDRAKAMINEAIAEKLDIKQLSSPSSNLFTIADLGCSVGPNTFFVVENIVESVKLKYQSHGLDPDTLEFQVLFNDHISNDFNTLFKSLPFNKQYYAAGVPGSFHGRLFPKDSLQFVHSSYALQWLSEVPKEVVDKQSPAWNKGRISYTAGAPVEVQEAYTTQFAKDMESFLNARALEIVSGGLMGFLMPCFPPNCSKYALTALFDLFGYTLMDLTSMGLVSEDKVDSFNLPLYHPTSQELESLIERNGYFSIERMEPLARLNPLVSAPDIGMLILHLRAGWEGLIREHFGSEIVDELFDQFKKKVTESNVLSDLSYVQMIELFVLLKRRVG